MATITQACSLGGMNFTLIYNDATMKLTSVEVVNNSRHSLYFALLPPHVGHVTWPPNTNTTYHIAPVGQPTFTQELVLNPDTGLMELMITGFEWRACAILGA